MKLIKSTTKYCNSNKDRTDDEDDGTIDNMLGLWERDRYDSCSDNGDPKETKTKTKNNPTSINRGVAAKSNQNHQNNARVTQISNIWC